MSSHKDKGLPESPASAAQLSDLDGLGGDAWGDMAAGGGLEDLAFGDELDPHDPIPPMDTEGMSNEEAAQRETSAVLEAFIARSRAEQERFALVTDSEYWVGLCFQTREQKDWFLREAKLLQAGDKYIDGMLLAQRMGIKLPPADVPYNVSAKVDPKYAALVKDL